MDQNVQSTEARTVQVRPNNDKTSTELEVKSSDYSQAKKPQRARFVYGIIFLITNLKAWFFRDYGQKVLARFDYMKACGLDGKDCCQTLGVLRIFFFFMFATTVKTRKLHEARNTWHSGYWTLKVILLIVSMGVPFFFPSNYIQIYGEIARIGAGIFLVLQLVSVIEFITWWNSYWMPKEMKQSCSFGLFMSTIFHIGSICGIGVMYFYYGRSIKCSLNLFFITWTAILLIVMMAVSLHSKVNRGLLSTGIMASYLVFLCWSALRSEPVNERCSKQSHANGNSDWTTIVGFLIAICAIVMATFSTGIDSQSFQFRKDTIQKDDIPYDYGFFHMVFSLGAMYFAMLFISWNLNNSARKWSIDVGWASTWVKIVNEWFAATIYIWKLISPVVTQAKVRDLEIPN